MRRFILLALGLSLTSCTEPPSYARFGVSTPITLPLPASTLEAVLADGFIEQPTSPAGRTLKWGLKPLARPVKQVNDMLESLAGSRLRPDQPTIFSVAGVGPYTALLREEGQQDTLWLGLSNSLAGRFTAITYTAYDRGTLLVRTPDVGAGDYALRLDFDGSAGRATADLAIENPSADVRTVMHWELTREGTEYAGRLAAVDATLSTGKLSATGLSVRFRQNGEGVALVGLKADPEATELAFVSDGLGDAPDEHRLFFDASLDALTTATDAVAELAPPEETMPATYPADPIAADPFSAPYWAFPE